MCARWNLDIKGLQVCVMKYNPATRHHCNSEQRVIRLLKKQHVPLLDVTSLDVK